MGTADGAIFQMSMSDCHFFSVDRSISSDRVVRTDSNDEAMILLIVLIVILVVVTVVIIFICILLFIGRKRRESEE